MVSFSGMLNDLLLKPILAVSEFTAKSAGLIVRSVVSTRLNQFVNPIVGTSGLNTIGLPEAG